MEYMWKLPMNRVTTFIATLLLSAALVPAHAMDSAPDGDSSRGLMQNSRDTVAPQNIAGSSALSMLFAQNALDREMPLALRPILGIWLLSILAIQSLESTKTSPSKGFLAQKIHYLKDRVIDNVGVPLYVAFERIKHEGPSKKDAGILGLVVLGLYGAKKTVDHYKLGPCIKALDFSDSRKVFSRDAFLLWNYKGRIALGLAATAAFAVLIKSAINLPIIERFRRSLTRQQKEIISSDETLRELLDKAHENPAALIDHDHFTSQLHEHQKQLLDKAVQKYKSEADPMSLFDDFVMDDEDL